MHAEAKIAKKIYVVLTSRGTDSPIFYSVEYDDQTPLICAIENTGNASAKVHEISQVFGVLKSCDSILSLASFGEKKCLRYWHVVWKITYLEHGR